MRPFNGWYDASAWCQNEKAGPCFVLTPGKVWEWVPCLGPGDRLLYLGPLDQRRIHGGVNSRIQRSNRVSGAIK